MVNVADAILSVVPNVLPDYLTHYIPGVTPLSDTPVVVATLAGYLGTIFSIQWFMKDKQPLKLTPFFRAHNAFLTGISGLLLVLIAEEIIPIWLQTGSFDAICHPRSWTPVRIYFRKLCRAVNARVGTNCPELSASGSNFTT